MKLTKSDYLNYLKCPREFWLRKKIPELFRSEDSIEGEHRKEMGYRVQLQAQTLFSNKDDLCEFERRFETERLIAKVDIFADDSIYEVKSTGSVKDEHIDDLAFQKIAAEAAGVQVKQTFLIHLNKEYVRRGEIEPGELLKIEDITELVDAKLPETRARISEIFEYLESEPDKEIRNYCKKDKLDCAFIRHFHKDLPEYTIFDINNFRGKVFDQLLEAGILNIHHVSTDLKLTDRQRKQVDVAQSRKPFASVPEIREIFGSLEFPVYFLDYETANPAIPIYDGYRPFEVIVFQYSIHVMEKDGDDLKHFEFLSDGKQEPTRDLLMAMREVIDETGGTIVVWSAYENTRNNEMGKKCAEFAGYLDSIGQRVFDLMDIFSKGHYIHPKFKGSPSIKTVLPVLVPHLNYEHLEIKQGSIASAVWLDMVSGEKTEEQRESVRSGLLEYCALDTQAMVEIFKFLRKEFCR